MWGSEDRDSTGEPDEWSSQTPEKQEEPLGDQSVDLDPEPKAPYKKETESAYQQKLKEDRKKLKEERRQFEEEQQKGREEIERESRLLKRHRTENPLNPRDHELCPYGTAALTASVRKELKAKSGEMSKEDLEKLQKDFRSGMIQLYNRAVDNGWNWAGLWCPDTMEDAWEDMKSYRATI
eukprot:gene11417-17790_t